MNVNPTMQISFAEKINHDHFESFQTETTDEQGPNLCTHNNSCDQFLLVLLYLAINKRIEDLLCWILFADE